MARKIWNEITIKEFIENETNYKFISMVKLNGMKSIVLVWCGNPNHKPYKVRFDAFKGTSKKEGTRCEQCRREKDTIWTKDEIIKYVESQDYKFIRFITYEKNNSLIEIKCHKGHINQVRFRKFKEGTRCTECNKSKGEEKVKDTLKEMCIDFKSQYKFKDCKCKKELPFDFYIPSLNIAIEYDGIQHFEILPHWGGIDKLIETKIHDEIKTQYCKRKRIKLIRIPYWEFKNIENILIKELVLN